MGRVQSWEALLAEPVSDILAATITAITFFSRFDKILDKGAGKV